MTWKGNKSEEVKAKRSSLPSSSSRLVRDGTIGLIERSLADGVQDEIVQRIGTTHRRRMNITRQNETNDETHSFAHEVVAQPGEVSAGAEVG